ncbi:MAG: hypothetical protein ACO23C_06905 [Prochlorococcaceae cyanobacterium]
MAPEVSAASGLRRLADQLQTLSELTESLTYRLIELEEKVAAVDLRLEPLLHGAASDSASLAEDTELRLDDTEERLARLEAVLAGLEMVPRGETPADQDELFCAQEQPIDQDPHFPDGDYEQPFLDEHGQDESLLEAAGDLDVPSDDAAAIDELTSEELISRELTSEEHLAA